MERLIIQHGWNHLTWVHLFEREKLELINKFIRDPQKYYTLEGRLGKTPDTSSQLKLL